MTNFEEISILITAIQTLVIVLGFFLAYRQLALLRKDSTNSLEITSRKHAMDLISRYSDSDYIDRRIALRTDENKQKDYYQCGYLLNFFEELAIAIKHKTANEFLLEDYFETILRGWMEEEFVVKTLTHFRKEDNAFYENLLWLYRKWEQKRQTKLSIDAIPELR